LECPHCNAEFNLIPHVFALGEDQDGSWQVSTNRCPTCDRLIVNLCTKQGASYPVRPHECARPRLCADVPADYANDYHIAARVLPHSPEASAALSRRLLHRTLAVKTAAGHGSLSDQIRQAILSSDLPPYLKQALQTLARVAKIESDAPKSEHPEILTPVEPGEPEWLLDVLQSLLDLYFVQPARMQRKQAELERLLAPASPPVAATPAATPAATDAGTPTADMSPAS
jgi:hypothetical protein